MIAAIVDFFFMILPLLATVCLIPAFYFNDSREYSASTFWFLVFCGLLAWSSWGEVTAITAGYGVIFSISVLAGSFVIGGVTTAFVYWFFFIFKARERFDRYMLEFTSFPNDEAEGLAKAKSWINKSDSAKRYLIIYNDSKLCNIFDGDASITRNISVKRLAGDLTDAEYDAEVAKVLPPRFAVCKPNIIGAAMVWPITLIWLLMSRVIKQLIERIISSFGGMFNKISSMAFGKF